MLPYQEGDQRTRLLVYDPGRTMQHVSPLDTSTALPSRAGLRGRLRELALASALGAAVVLWPGDGSLSQAPWQTPPPYVRALRWRDLVRLRLSPWLLIQSMLSSDRDQSQTG